MTIRNLEGPVDGRHVVHQALNRLFGNRPEFADGSCVEAPLGGGTAQMPSGGQFGTSQPIPVFRADLDRIRDTSFLSEVRRIGWRYLVVDRNGAVAIADVRETGGGGVVFSRMTPGLPAERLLRATRLAAGTYGDKVAGNYELRILEIPVLSKSALWLHQAKSQRKQDVFFPIMGGYKSDNVQEDPSFMDAVHSAAAVGQGF